MDSGSYKVTMGYWILLTNVVDRVTVVFNTLILKLISGVKDVVNKMLTAMDEFGNSTGTGWVHNWYNYDSITL